MGDDEEVERYLKTLPCVFGWFERAEGAVAGELGELCYDIEE